MDWQRLQLLLQGELPGIRSQQVMSPQYRPVLSAQETENFLASAVLLLLYISERKDELSTLLIERPTDQSIHSGQLCFPGGRSESTDLNYEMTALRETKEELGIASSNIHILGALSSLIIPISKYRVHPFVGYCDHPPQYHPNTSEVAAVMECPIHSMMTSKSAYTTSMRGRETNIPYFPINNKKLWGASAMIMNEFLDLYKTL